VNRPILPPEISAPAEHPHLKDDPKLASGKIAAFQYLAIAIFLFLISGFWELQVKKRESYSELAERNRIKYYPVLAPRGRILDRDGRTIVDNHLTWTLLLARETLKPEHLPGIAAGLGLDLKELELKLARFKKRPTYMPVPIKEDLSPEDLAFVESHRDADSYPELELLRAQRRLYPQNGMAAHTIGYTGEISETELDDPAYVNYKPGDLIGKFGIERQYNDFLMGVDGQRQVLVDSRGTERQVIGIKEPVPGKRLQLTLDLDLQVVAELAMEGRQGAAVAIDPRNGEVLASVSRPTFDPNKFTVRILSKDWREYADDPNRPLFNRAIQAQLAPGSTFKPIMAVAGIDSGTVEEDTNFHCAGGASFYGHYHACWQKRGHGTISLHRGIAQSCDVYFYNLGNKMGIDTINHYAEMMGLGHRTGIDLPSEASGLVPSSSWKIRTQRSKWYPGETISVAIGQGATIVSPLQLVSAIASIGVGGKWYRPHLLRTDTPNIKPRIIQASERAIQDSISGMCAVVNEGGGTGGRSRLPGIEVCGKTGSAQIASEKFTAGKNIKTNAWFVAFAPRENPEIAVVALLENAGHGGVAAPIVRDVIKAYFDKKAARRGEAPKPIQMEAPTTEEDNSVGEH
jgi:penicillin-binding protein 2